MSSKDALEYAGRRTRRRQVGAWPDESNNDETEEFAMRDAADVFWLGLAFEVTLLVLILWMGA